MGFGPIALVIRFVIMLMWVVRRLVSAFTHEAEPTDTQVAKPTERVFHMGTGGWVAEPQMEALEMRQVPITLEETGMEGVALEIKGLIPVKVPTNIRFVTSVLDRTNLDPSNKHFPPVYSWAKGYQEDQSQAYQVSWDGPLVEPMHVYTEWLPVGIVFPDLLQPAYGGRRKLVFVCRLVDKAAPRMIQMGLCLDQARVIAEQCVEYEFDYAGKGYKEVVVERDESHCHAITLAMQVAMADGDLNKQETHVMQQWVMRTIAPFEGERRAELQDLYFNAMGESHAKLKDGNLVKTNVIARMNEIAEEPQKHEALTLCFDVMSADGTLADSELREIRNIAVCLKINWSKFEALKDKALIGASSGENGQASLEAILGIDENWRGGLIMTYLRQQYAKWNDRLNALPEGPERDNAQRMLDLIAQARVKYDS